MASFMKPKPAAAEKLPALSEDPERGEVSKKSQSSDLVIKAPEPPQRVTSPLFPEAYLTGNVKKSGKRKSRKDKKRAHKKTQKRRGRK